MLNLAVKTFLENAFIISCGLSAYNIQQNVIIYQGKTFDRKIDNV